jgi:hypothetical protein
MASASIECAEGMPVARDQPASTVFDIRESPEAVEFRLFCGVGGYVALLWKRLLTPQLPSKRRHIILLIAQRTHGIGRSRAPRRS